jgi:hypothetical protein
LRVIVAKGCPLSDAAVGAQQKVAVDAVDLIRYPGRAAVTGHPAPGIALQHDTVEALAALGADEFQDRRRSQTVVVLAVAARAIHLPDRPPRIDDRCGIAFVGEHPMRRRADRRKESSEYGQQLPARARYIRPR